MFPPAIVLAAALSAAATSAPVEIRFCPEAVIRSYPDRGTEAQTLLLPTAAVLNRSDAQLLITGVDVELWGGGAPVDRRRLEGGLLATVAEAAYRTASRDVDLFPAQLCDGRLLGDHEIVAVPGLDRGQALLVADQVFGYGGVRDELRLRVRGVGGDGPFEAVAAVPISGAFGEAAYRFPLRGNWFVAAGPSLHSHHRWGVFEAFALDLVRLGPGGATHAGRGDRFEDYFAYGAEVLAAADGVVVVVVDDEPEDPATLRRPEESAQDYLARTLEAQTERLTRGARGLAGNHVVVRHAQGEYATYAHLQPGAVVAVGDTIAQGQMLGRLGSSGNSGEPHLHFHLCDRASAVSCAGIPVRFEGVVLPLALGPRPIQTGDLVVAP